MIYVFHKGLNPNEVYVVKRILETMGAEPFSVKDIQEEGLPQREALLSNGNKVVLVFDATKAKSAFEKEFEQVYCPVSAMPHLRIDRPNTFKKSDEQMMKVWNSLKEFVQGENSQELRLSELPDNINKSFGSLLDQKNQHSVMILKDDKGQKLEIRPDDAEPGMEQSLTYTELVLLTAARYAFHFSKLELTNPRLGDGN